MDVIPRSPLVISTEDTLFRRQDIRTPVVEGCCEWKKKSKEQRAIFNREHTYFHSDFFFPFLILCNFHGSKAGSKIWWTRRASFVNQKRIISRTHWSWLPLQITYEVKMWFDGILEILVIAFCWSSDVFPTNDYALLRTTRIVTPRSRTFMSISDFYIRCFICYWHRPFLA